MSLLFRSTPFHLKQQGKLNKRSFSLSIRALAAGQQLSLAPPFTRESATIKVKNAQALWNTKDPEKVAKAYTEDSVWRNRDQFFIGHHAIKSFLQAKWAKENGYRLRKELFAWTENKIAVQFWYEFKAEAGWRRCYGLEDWTFAEDGRMRKRQMSGNEISITEEQRWFKEGVDVDRVEISEDHW